MSGKEKKSYGSASGATDLFIVESRTSYIVPQNHGGMILDGEWRRVNFQRSQSGIPVLAETIYPDATRNGLLNWEAAVALAGWWMALPDQSMQFPFSALCVETRIVKVRYSYKWDTEEIGVGPTMNATAGLRATEWKERE